MWAIPARWVEPGILARVDTWQDVRQEYERAGHYTYIEANDGRFVFKRQAEYPKYLDEVRSQVTAQSVAQIDPISGALKRGAQDMVKKTMHIWKTWYMQPDSPSTFHQNVR